MASSINASTTAGVVTTADTSGTLNIQTAGTTAISIDASQAVSFTNSANLPNTFGFKNRIINGAMVIDQRNAGASVTPTVDQYILDRWFARITNASKLSFQQSSTAPSNFIKSTLITSLSSYSVASTEHFGYNQAIEGFNISDLNWGTASAATVSLSFSVRSSLTGTFGGMLTNSTGTRSYVFSYTINSANTFENKTVTIAGDTSGTWLTDNGQGITVSFSLGAGSSVSTTAGSWNGSLYRNVTGGTSVVGTNGATFYITGVQLEKGSTATSFDYRPYGTELQLCQRYYQQIGKSNNVSYQPYGTGVCTSTTAATLIINLPVMMRGTPTFTFNGATNTFSGSVGVAVTSVISDVMSSTTIMYQAVVASGLVAGNGARHYQSATSASSLELSAEL
jgi:hypothetical protein